MKTCTKFFLCLVLCVTLAARRSFAAARGIERAESRAEAARLWELAVAAKGGRERLRSVRSFPVTASRRNYLNAELYAFPNKFRRWSGEPKPFGVSAEID